MNDNQDKQNNLRPEIMHLAEYYNKLNNEPEHKPLAQRIADIEKENADMVNHPQHYKTGKIECIDCISAVVNMYDGEQAYDVGQIIKYLYRAPTKQNFMQDLKKAQWYLNRLIKIASKQNK